MSNLRFVERDGKMILQEKKGFECWEDVPTHKEPKKVSVEDELSKYLANSSGFSKTHAHYFNKYAKYSIEFMKQRMPSKKERSFQEILKNPCDLAKDHEERAYNQALKDVRKALFGEE